MTKWLLTRRAEADVELTPFEIEMKVPEDADKTESGGFECFRTALYGLFDTRFEWELVPQEDTYRLVEDAYISSKLFFFTALAWMGMVISTVVTLLVSGFGFVVLLTASFFSTFVFGFLIWVQISVDSPLDQVLRKGDDRSEYMPVASFVVGVLLLVLLLVSGIPGLQVVALLGSVALPVVYWIFNDWVVERSFWWQDRMLDTVGRLPAVFGNYFTGMLLMTVIVALFLGLMQNQSFYVFLDYSPFLFVFSSAAAFIFLSAYVLRTFSEAQQIESVQFEYYGLDEFSWRRRWVLIAAAVLVSVFFVGISAYAFVQGLNLVDRVGFPTVYLVMLAALIPSFYVLTGTVYQLYGFLYGNTELYLNSKSSGLDLGTEYPVRVLDSDVCMAGSVSLGFHGFIVVSEALIDRLSRDELEAVAAHEEAHFEYGDTRVALLVAALTPFVFTGRNVLFSVLGFREREHRADEYAAEKIGQDSLIGALDRLQNVRYEESITAVPEFSPTITNFQSERVRDLWDRIYGFYYGSFALSNAHPSIEQRKTALQEESNTN